MRSNPGKSRLPNPQPGPPGVSGDEAASRLLTAAAAQPLPLHEVVARLGASLHRNIAYLQRRERRGWQGAYDAVLESDVEAIASAIVLLQKKEVNE